MNHIPMRARALVAVGTIASLCASALSPAQAHETPAQARSSGVLVYPYLGADLWVKSLDPAALQDTQSLQVVNLVYSGLLRLDGQNRVIPDLAVALPAISADKKTFTFKIRPDARFSDGTPVTAQDCVYSWTRALSKKEASPVAMTYMGTVVGAAGLNNGKTNTLVGVKAIDTQTVQITFTTPGTYLLGELTYTSWYVVKQNITAGENLVGASSQALNIGSGPFMFSKPWRFRQEMYLAPNPHWYDAAKIKIGEIDVPMISDFDAAYREYQAGQVPMSVVPPAFLPVARSLPDFHSGPQLTIDYISANGGKDALCKPVTCAPFNDLHFRKAMLYAIDRHTINSKILHGYQTDLCGIVPQGIDGFDNKDLCPLAPYDPARARTELALALKDFGGKIPNAGRLTLVYQTRDQSIVNEYTEVQNELAAVGININLKGMPFNEWVTLVTVNSTPLIENAWQDDYPDAQDFTHNLLSIYGAYDITNYSDPIFEKLAGQADVTPNGPDRTNLYIAAQKRALAAVAFIPIGQTVLSWRWKSNIQGMMISSGFNYPVAANNDWTNTTVQ